MKLARLVTPCGKGWLHVLVWLSLFVGSPLQSAAQEPPSDASASWLQVDARADGCVSEAALWRQVERMLDQEPHDRVRVQARARGRGWVVELWHASGQYAVREFSVLPDDCDVRSRALALAIALAVEHGVDPARPQARARDNLEVGWAIGLHAGGSVGELPTAAALLGVDARIERGPWVLLELRALADVWSSEPSFAGARLATRQLVGALGSCLGPGAKRAWRLDVCLGVELGAVLGRAHGIAQPETAAAGSGALNLGLAARWSSRRRYAVTARLEGFARFWTPRFRVLEADGGPFAERELPRAGGRLWFGLTWLSK